MLERVMRRPLVIKCRNTPPKKGTTPPKSRTSDGGFPSRSSDAAVLAAERGEEEAVLEWLDSGGRADATCERGGVNGVTLLMGAARKGHERVAALLLQRGAEVSLQRSDGGTALMAAANQGHERVVELLIRHGAEINLLDSNGYTAPMPRGGDAPVRDGADGADSRSAD